MEINVAVSHIILTFEWYRCMHHDVLLSKQKKFAVLTQVKILASRYFGFRALHDGVG
jgi:hypothetical protein